jgi:hypothetical protein
LQKITDTIEQFINIKQKCIFCHKSLRPTLSNFIGVKKDSFPLLNEIVINPIKFLLKQTTENYNIEANTNIDINLNTISFNIIQESPTVFIDQYIAKTAFLDLSPYIDLACHNKLCKKQYYLASNVLKIYESNNRNWQLQPLKLFIESFKVNNLLVQNDWIREETNIYSLTSNNSIKIPFLDFTQDNLIHRVQMYATFN